MSVLHDIARSTCLSAAAETRKYLLITLARKVIKSVVHWRRQGGARGPAPQWPGQNFFLLTRLTFDFEHHLLLLLSSPAKPGCACYDNPTGRGYFYQMSNMYTCIAYLIEMRKFCSKTWFIKVLILRPKNKML